MILKETQLAGAYVIEPQRIQDERGFFVRTFDREAFAAHGLDPAVIQCNVSYNAKEGTLRGMHLQNEPHGEPKLVRVTSGAVFDVIVDLRKDSPTYKKWVGLELSRANGLALFVPVGFAHGFQTLKDDTEVSYQMGAAYHAKSAGGVRWDDPSLAIQWPDAPGGKRIISERDRSYPDIAS